jgi:hypothetical protein
VLVGLGTDGLCLRQNWIQGIGFLSPLICHRSLVVYRSCIFLMLYTVRCSDGSEIAYIRLVDWCHVWLAYKSYELMQPNSYNNCYKLRVSMLTKGEQAASLVLGLHPIFYSQRRGQVRKEMSLRLPVVVVATNIGTGLQLGSFIPAAAQKLIRILACAGTSHFQLASVTSVVPLYTASTESTTTPSGISKNFSIPNSGNDMSTPVVRFCTLWRGFDLAGTGLPEVEGSSDDR